MVKKSGRRENGAEMNDNSSNFIQSQNLTENETLSVTSSQETLSQENESNFRKPVLFKQNKKHVDDAFNISFDESRTISDVTSSSSVTVNKANLFSKSKRRMKDAFDVNFEESVSTLDTPNSSSLPADRARPFMKVKKFREDDAFHITNDESKNLTDVSNITYTPSNKILPFVKSKTNQVNAFKVTAEESKTFTDSPDTSYAPVKKSLPFTKQRATTESAFDVGEEEEDSRSFSHIEDSSQPTKNRILPFSTGKRIEEDPFDINDEETATMINVKNVSSPQVNRIMPFIKTKQSLQRLSVSAVADESVDSTDMSPSLSHINNKLLLINKKNKKTNDSFNVNFEESTAENTANVSVNSSRMKNIFQQKSGDSTMDASQGNSSGANNLEKDNEKENLGDTTAGDWRNESLPLNNSALIAQSDLNPESFGVRNENNRSILSKLQSSISEVPLSNVTSASIPEDQSFNDENLNEWMSDHSDEEMESRPEDLNDDGPPGNDPVGKEVPFEETSVEDREQRYKMKLQALIEGAKQKKINESPVVEKRAAVAGKEKPEKKDENAKSNRGIPKFKKPAAFVTRRLYDDIIAKLRPAYGLDSVLQAEDIIESIAEAVKIVTRRKPYQKKIINDLKRDMAKMGLIETTHDFYDFVRRYLPYSFRVKVIPCIQPLTNIVYPPKDAKSPFDKIL